MRTQVNKETLFNYFAGRCTVMQKNLIEQWLKEEENIERYYEWLEEWERQHPQFETDLEGGLENYKNRLQEEPSITAKAYRASMNRNRAIRYAAVFILVAVVLAATQFRGLVHYKTYSTSFGEVKTVQLEDGSSVTLNANSVLTVPRFGFGEKTRVVKLHGEAAFAVVHTAGDKKFIVQTPNQLEVEVLGTEFIVYTRAQESKVVLSSGEVLLRSMTDTVPHTMTIKPGDVVTIREGALKLKHEEHLEPHIAWKDQRFVFDRTPLHEVVFKIEERFGVELQIADTTLGTRVLTGTYEADNADEMLDVLAKVFDLEISKDGKKVTLSRRAL